jgi:hypothetical protein
MWIPQNSSERWLRLPRGSRSLASQRHRFRPRLEGHENRTVLSTLTVLNTLDKGAGSWGGLYLADGGVACLDAFTQAHTTNNQATTDHDEIFGSFMTC